MRKLLSLTLLALVFTASASASTLQQKLDQSASFIAGKQVHEICYQSQSAWDAYAKANGYVGENTLGLSIPGGNINRYSPEVCWVISAVDDLGVRQVPVQELAEAVLVLAHEPELSYLPYTDNVDAQAEACAPLFYAKVANTVFGIEYHTALMRKIINVTLVLHKTETQMLGVADCPR